MCLFNKLFMVLGNGGSPINKTDTVPALKNLTVWEGRQTPSCDFHAFEPGIRVVFAQAPKQRIRVF